MPDPERFEYTIVSSQTIEAALLPQLPLILTYKNQSLETAGLLDTGATVNVLPYSLGLRLGAQWDPESPAITLTGNLAQFGARPIIVAGSVGKFPSVRLAFAWTRSEDVPLIPWAGQFLCGIRCLFLSFTPSLRCATQRLG